MKQDLSGIETTKIADSTKRQSTGNIYIKNFS